MATKPSRIGKDVRIEPDVGAFMRLLRQTPDRVDLGVRKRFREIAAKVRDKARAKASGGRPVAKNPREKPQRGQHWKDLVNSIRSGSTGKSPHVSIGTPRVPWALGHEFGSHVYRQFPPWRGNKRGAGYFLYPTVGEMAPEVRQEMVDVLNEVYRDLYPD